MNFRDRKGRQGAFADAPFAGSTLPTSATLHPELSASSRTRYALPCGVALCIWLMPLRSSASKSCRWHLAIAPPCRVDLLHVVSRWQCHLIYLMLMQNMRVRYPSSVSRVSWNSRYVLIGPIPRLTLRVHEEARQMKRRLGCNETNFIATLRLLCPGSVPMGK